MKYCLQGGVRSIPPQRSLAVGFGQMSVLLLAWFASACGTSAPNAEPKVASAPAGSGPASDGQAAATGPGVFEASMQHEADNLTEHDVAGPAGAWSARPLTRAAPTVRITEGVAVVLLPIGAETPVTCQIMPDTVDAGAIIAKALGSAAAAVNYERIAPTGIKVVGQAPAAFVDAVYTVDKSGVKAAGFLKLVSYPKSPFLTFCLHDEPGYRASFERVVSSFFESFKLATAAAPAPQYADVGITSIAGVAVGFQTTKVVALDKTQRRVIQYSVNFLPTSPKDLVISDDYTLETTDLAGRLLEGVWVSAQGGEIQRKIKLSRGAGGHYTFTGELSGKPLQGEFSVKAAKGLPSTLSTASDLKAKLAKPAPFAFKLDEYHPDLDPTRPISVGYTREKATGERAVLVQFGDMQAHTLVDAQGIAERVELRLGGRSLLMQREYFQGAP